MSVIVGEPVTASESGAWLSIQDAARHLSVSERTIYRKADQGKLRRRSRPDGRVEVFVPMTPPSDKSDESSDNDSQPSALLLVEHLTHALTRQAEVFNAELAASRQRIEDLARENGRLSAELAASEARHAALLASGATEPSDPSTEPGSDAGAPDASTADRPGAPWWRRWRAWLAAGLVIAVLGSASCQTSASVKHAGLCTSAHATMDFLATTTNSGRMVSNDIWAVVRDSIGTAEKVC